MQTATLMLNFVNFQSLEIQMKNYNFYERRTYKGRRRGGPLQTIREKCKKKLEYLLK
ncbi:hypothetical protein PGB90_006928 [Kerria lacca]